jgi:hypothetical protein
MYEITKDMSRTTELKGKDRGREKSNQIVDLNYQKARKIFFFLI